MPRRYHQYVPEFQVWNVLSSAGASILAVGYCCRCAICCYSLRYGKRAGDNPWRATGLEWQTPSPPPRGQLRRNAGRRPRARTNITRERPKMSLERALFTPDEQERLFDHTFLRRAAAGRAIRQPRSAARNGCFRDVGLPGHRGDVLQRAVHLRRRLPRTCLPRPSRRPASS